MTKRLYYADVTATDFEARVVESGKIDGQPAVVLNISLFYPTSGGQMHDTGIIGEAKVIDVIVKDDKVWHILDKPVSGEHVRCKLDWNRRFDFMQQHTAFHILAASFRNRLGVDTLSSHLGENDSTIDVNSEGIKTTQLQTVEDFANQVIWENRPVRAFWAGKFDLESPLLRKKPEAVHEKIRLVEIDKLDLDPCGGTHVTATGQVGFVKITGSEKIRGYTRYTFVAGGRAWRDLQKQYAATTALGQLLTTGTEGLPTAVEKLVQENKKISKALQNFEKETEERIIVELAQMAAENPLVSKCIADKTPEALRRIAGAVVKQTQGTFLLGSTGETPCVAFATTKPDLDLRPLLKQILPLIEGRGGGSAAFVQGGGTNSAAIAGALDQALALLQ